MSPICSKIDGALRVVLAFNDAFNRHDLAGMMQLICNWQQGTRPLKKVSRR